MLNCCLNNHNSVGKTNELKIIIKDNQVIFNIRNILDKFFSKTKNPELLKKAFNLDQNKLNYNIKKNYIDGHFNFSISSDKYKDKNISKNLTSSKFINVVENDKTIQLPCKDGFYPNVRGEDKINFYTPTYFLDKTHAKIQMLKPAMIFPLQQATYGFHNSVLNDKNDQILTSFDGKFFKDLNGMTVKQYCYEYKIPIYQDIVYMDEFEEANKSFLEVEANRIEYEIVKSLLSNIKYINNGE
jgi:hypothetical protein